jgi:tetratricopeptide (TPR) repeat protein
MASSLRRLPLFLVLAGAAMAQTSQIEGMVKGADGQGLKDALIKIERKDIKGSYKVKTRKKGDYLHAGLPLGTYLVVLEVDGREVDKVDNVRTRLGEPSVVNFDLQAMQQKQAAMQKAAESGTLTQEQARDMSPEQKAQIEKAMKERQAALAKNKELNDAFNQGMEALKTKQFDAAVAAFEKASTMDPKQHVVWGNLAEAYSEMGKVKTGAEQEATLGKAVDAYNKALELVPNDASYRNNLALVYARMKKFPEMEAELNKAVALDATNAGRYYFNMGAVLTNNQQTEAACNAFKKATEADPNYADAHYQLGMCYTSKATVKPDGSTVFPEGTQQAFQKYIELKPDGPNAESAKGMLQAMGSKVETEYTNPAAPKKPVPAKKK